MSNEMQLLDNLLREVILQPIETEVIPLQNAFNKIIENYKFIFNDDEQITKNFLIKACFETDLGENKINKDFLLSSIPEDTKKEIYEKALPQILKLLTVEDLR